MVTSAPRLRERISARLDDWRWRLRYWWLDTEDGAHAQLACFCMAVFVVLAEVVRVMLRVAAPPAPQETTQQQAVVWWVVQLIVVLVSLVLSYVFRPRIPKQQTPIPDGPTVEDGLCVDDHFGEVWVTDEHILAWKVVKTEKIKSKGGKK